MHYLIGCHAFHLAKGHGAHLRPCTHQRADVCVALWLFVHVPLHDKVSKNRGFGKCPEALTLCSDPHLPLKKKMTMADGQVK